MVRGAHAAAVVIHRGAVGPDCSRGSRPTEHPSDRTPERPFLRRANFGHRGTSCAGGKQG